MKTKKVLAFIMALALISVPTVSNVAYANESNTFVASESIIIGENDIDELPIMVKYEELNSTEEVNLSVANYSASQENAYKYITAACNEFLESKVTLSTNAFKVVTLTSGLSITEIGTVVNDIKLSGLYPVLNKVALYSSEDNNIYDKIVLFTKYEYRTAEGRENARVIDKPEITTLTPGEGSVALTWNAVPGATKYRVFTYLNGEYTAVGDVTTTSLTVSGLTGGTEYGFAVRAYVNGTWSPFTTADIKYATPEAASNNKPEITTLTPGAGSVELNWTAVDGASKYIVYTYLNGEYTAVGSVTTTTLTVSGLTGGTEYGFAVRAYVNGAWSPFTSADIRYATPYVSASNKPEITTLTPGEGSVALTWTAVPDATKYRVFTYLNGTYTAVGDVTSTSMNVTGLTGGTKYGFAVRAYVNGAWSPFTSADIRYATPKVASNNKPEITTLTPGVGSVELNWTAVAGASKYIVYTYLNGEYTAVGNVTTTSLTVSGLTGGTEYGFAVRAYVNGTWSPFTTADIKYATPMS